LLGIASAAFPLNSLLSNNSSRFEVLGADRTKDSSLGPYRKHRYYSYSGHYLVTVVFMDSLISIAQVDGFLLNGRCLALGVYFTMFYFQRFLASVNFEIDVQHRRNKTTEIHFHSAIYFSLLLLLLLLLLLKRLYGSVLLFRL
jgi:hypothetical protein